MGRELSKASGSTPEAITNSDVARHRLIGAKTLIPGALLAWGMVCLAVVIGLLPASAAASPTPTNDLGRLCAQAAGLTQAGKPAEALALIEKIRGQVRSPALAATTACEDERLAAVLKAQQPAPPPRTTPAQDIGAGWDRFATEWMKPLLNAGLALLGLVVFFLVLGRLLVFVPKMPFVKMRPAWRAGLLFGGLGLILLGSVGMVLALGTAAAAAGLGRAIWGLIAIEWGFVALGGAVALAFYLSSRLRVLLEVRGGDGKNNDADGAHIAALLHELGTAPPRGIEVPVGTDVVDLHDTALAMTFSNKLLAAAQKILTSIFGVTPWKVAVSPVGENALTVTIMRNGWAVESASIDRKALNLPGEAAGGAEAKPGAPKPAPRAQTQLHMLAAALILATLAGKHRGFEGLCGATDWRSLGLHCIATTDPGLSEEQQKQLLGSAVNYDAGNMLAEVALQHSLFRDSTDKQELANYAQWLFVRAVAIRKHIARGSKLEAGYAPLLYRIELTFLNVVLNLPVHDSEFDPWRRRAWEVAGHMVYDLAPSERVLVPAPWAHAMRLHAALAYKDLDPAPTENAAPYQALYTEALASIAPQTAYNAACSIARNRGVEAEPDVRGRLRYAFADPGLKEWARSDPELAEFRKNPDFLEFLGVRLRQDFWKLEAFEPYEKRLREAGIGRPHDLYAHEVGQSDISAYLQVNPLVIKRLARLAAFVRRAEAVVAPGEAEPVKKFRVEVIGALIQAGIERPEDIPHGEGSINTGFVERLSKSIEQRALIAPDAGQLKAWLRQLKETPPEDPAG